MGENAMKLLVPRITDATTRKDLREFAKIVSCRILLSSDSTGVEQRHGLFDVTPDDAATKIIRKLNGAFLGGRRVGVKRYDSAFAR
jgi:hypothetical protein